MVNLVLGKWVKRGEIVTDWILRMKEKTLFVPRQCLMRLD